MNNTIIDFADKKAVQASFDELTKASEISFQAATDANKVAEDYKKQVQLLTKAAVDLSDTIKNIHMKLNEHCAVVDQVEELHNMRKELAKFVLSTSMIKLGVISEHA